MAGETTTPGETTAHEPPPAEEQTLTSEQTGESEPEHSEPESQTPEPVRMIPADVFAREMGPLRQRNRELESAFNEQRRQIAEANELIRRLQQGGDQRIMEQPRNQVAPTTDQDVEQRALELNFQRDARRVSEAGLSAYGQQMWDDACKLMDGLGLNSAPFVATVMEVVGTDRTHEVFRAIAEDPERAARIAGMTPMRRIAEISRISEQMPSKIPGQPSAARPARTVSRAPEPAPRVNTGTRTAKDWRTDDVSDEEFSRAWDEHQRNRSNSMRR